MSAGTPWKGIHVLDVHRCMSSSSSNRSEDGGVLENATGEGAAGDGTTGFIHRRATVVVAAEDAAAGGSEEEDADVDPEPSRRLVSGPCGYTQTRFRAVHPAQAGICSSHWGFGLVSYRVFPKICTTR